jgi:hypothetical protein
MLLIAVSVGASASRPTSPECVEVRGEAKYRNYGYDHIVHLTNRCSTDARCDVSTNVNSEVRRVVVPSGQQVEVLTLRGSPAREFTPIVECQFAL